MPVTGDIIAEEIGETALFPGDGSAIESPSGELEYRVIAYNITADWVIGVALDPVTGDEAILHTYSAPNFFGSPWVARIDSCCRLSSLVNAGDDYYRVETLVDLTKTDHSPVSSLPPIVGCQQDSVCTFAIPAADPEPGTTLNWRLATTTESEIFQPAGLTVQYSTGVVSWDTTGKTLDSLWAAQVIVEKRDGSSQVLTKVAVDFIVRIVPPGDPPVIDPEPMPGQPPVCNTTVPVRVGDTVTFIVRASDPDALDVVTLNSAGLPTSAITMPELPTLGNPVSATFTWTVTADDVGSHVLNFTATDNADRQAFCPVTVNVLPRLAGVTVLAHGYDVRGGTANPLRDYWGTNKVQALITKLGGGVVYEYGPTTGTYDESDHPFSDRDENGERVLVFDWEKVSNDPEAGQAEAAADALFASLVAAGYANPTNPAQSAHFHFIGHSRGCSVISETVQRLGTYGITVDYVTYLDAHDFGQPGEPSRTGKLDKGGGIPFDEEFHDPAVQVWSNVLYADNYWQTNFWDYCNLLLNPMQAINPAGRPLAHIEDWPDGEDRDLTQLVADPLDPANILFCARPHGRVIDYYWGTITPGSENHDWYPDGTGATSGFSKWFDDGGYGRMSADPSLTILINPNTADGAVPFDWSVWNDDNDPYYHDNKYSEKEGNPPIAFMGDFDMADLQQTIAGWEFHGGGGGGLVKVKKGKGYLILSGVSSLDRHFRQHNRLYIPANVTEIQFDLAIPKASSTDSLQFYIGSDPVGNPISLAVKNKNYTSRSAMIPQIYRNTVNTFKFQINRDANLAGPPATVYLDNIRFTMSNDPDFEEF